MKFHGCIIILFLLSVIVDQNVCYSQNKDRSSTITKIIFSYDTLQPLEFKNYFRIGLKAVKANGHSRKTRGFNCGLFSWRKFNISVENGSFKNGWIFFDRQTVYSNGRNVKIHISPKNNPSLNYDFFVPVPYINKIELNYDSTSVLAPGFKLPVSLKSYYSNGKTYTTDRLGTSKKISWKNFILSHKNEILNPPLIKIPPLSDSIMHSYEIVAKWFMDTSIYTKKDIPIDYKASYYMEFNGIDGISGADGPDGATGDFDGEDGYDGYDGEGGHDADNIRIFVETYTATEDTLLKISVVSANKQESAIINPNGGDLAVYCNGGNGGTGGNGGKGANGINETDEHEAEHGGNGGNGGNGGAGGNGGKVKIYCEKEAENYLSCFYVENRGGYGGSGGIGGKHGRGGFVTHDKPFISILFNIIGLKSGTIGRDGLNGYGGNWGPLPVIYILK